MPNDWTLAQRSTKHIQAIYCSLAETEERASDFICQRKLKTGKYLINCIKMPIHLRTDEDRVEMLMDLSSRLVQWRHQEPDIIEFDKDLEDVVDVPSEKLSPL